MQPEIPGPLRRLQDRIITLLGSSPDARGPLVAGMLRRDVSEATSYWLHLVVSVGIATMGLVLDSVAVIIGAMLVAPLMGPIVTLGVGLATGSPFLVLRAAGRVGLSIAVVIFASAAITTGLPFHSMTSELSARTSPTALDLVTAAFCALAGVYATLRPGSDTATTAAGTSIGISLVPPLCTTGYALATGGWSAGGGSLLLFLTNFVAIVVVATVSFVSFGFNQVDVVTLEEEELGRGGDAPIARMLARKLSALFASAGGPWLRFLMPFALLAAVYVPLRSALDEVAWQVRVRSGVERAIAALGPRVVESRIRVERQEVQVGLVTLGSTTDVDALRRQLDAEIRQASGVAPVLEIVAVPDAAAFAGLESSLRARGAPVAAPEPSPVEVLDRARAHVLKSLERRWPRASAGDPLAIELGLDAEALRVRVTHVGAPLDAPARELLTRAIGDDLGRVITFEGRSLPAELTSAEGALPFLTALAELVAGVRSAPALSLCVEEPVPPKSPKRIAAPRAELDREVRRLLDGAPRVTRTPGASEWIVRVTPARCPTGT
ncbi:DUF389 domain-containing protein [Myxococcota bacterium]|nr:DUF389 domain-containing protein [Myxococcota bacterium]